MFTQLHLEKSELQKVPYLKNFPADGRMATLLTYIETPSGAVRGWIPRGTQLQELQPISLVEGSYVAETSACPETDLPLPLSECVLQHLSFPGVGQIARTIEQDFLNSLSSIHKCFLITDHFTRKGTWQSKVLINTEMEYAFGNFRSFYDRLHELVRVIHRRLATVELPGSFDDLSKIASTNDPRNKYALKQSLVEFYAKRTKVFSHTKNIRDSIYHQGQSPEAPFHFQDGLAISGSSRLFAKLEPLGIWSPGTKRNESLYPILAIFAFLSQDMVNSMEELSERILALFDPPPTAVAPGYHVFLRTTLAMHYRNLSRYQKQPWISPEEILGA